MENIDRKFRFIAVCYEHGHVHDESDGIVFLAKDKALPSTLRFYRQQCELLGAADPQLKGIDLLIERVETWQRLNANLLKVPDVDIPEGAHIIAKNL